MMRIQRPSGCRALRGVAAFTLVEVNVATAIFAAFALTSVFAMVQFNRIASVNRYLTLASLAAQQRMDEVMTTSWSISATRPAVLQNGTTEETNLPLNHDAGNGASGLSSLYTAADTVIPATRRTTITTLSGGTRLLQASVTVSYTYRGRDYAQTLSSIRATDDF